MVIAKIIEKKRKPWWKQFFLGSQYECSKHGDVVDDELKACILCVSESLLKDEANKRRQRITEMKTALREVLEEKEEEHSL